MEIDLVVGVEVIKIYFDIKQVWLWFGNGSHRILFPLFYSTIK